LGEITDEFEISDNLSLEEIRERINDWLGTKIGQRFSLERVSDSQFILRRTKYDLRSCTSPCCGIIVASIYLGAIGASGMNFVLGFGVILASFVVAGLLDFFLRPRKAAYTMVFDHGTPTRVKVDARIRLLESIPEYYSLKVRLRNPTQEQDPLLAS
jgi:hypothetical protein